jgi:hypothetical protein
MKNGNYCYIKQEKLFISVEDFNLFDILTRGCATRDDMEMALTR